MIYKTENPLEPRVPRAKIYLVRGNIYVGIAVTQLD